MAIMEENKEKNQQQQRQSIILAIDAGSSSIRCTAYEYNDCHHASDGSEHNGYGNGDDVRDGGHGDDCCNEQETSQSTPSLAPLIRPIEEASHTLPMASVIPNTGYIRIHDVLTAIDECVDEVLRSLRSMATDVSSTKPEVEHDARMRLQPSFQIVAIGFSTFVMNLVGVDEYGEPVGESATLSYACNREDVVRECQTLRE